MLGPTHSDDTVEVPTVMRAFDPKWTMPSGRQSSRSFRGQPSDNLPLGCHRPRVPDRVCFEAIAGPGFLPVLCLQSGSACGTIVACVSADSASDRGGALPSPHGRVVVKPVFV